MIELTIDKQTIEIQWKAFAGGERHVQLPPSNTAASKVDITLKFQTNEDIIDLLLLVNALRHQHGDINISLSMPYLPYGRQDRVCATGQAFSLEVFAGLIANLNLSNITTWDCHSEVGLRLLQATNIAPETIIANSPTLVHLLQADATVLICPDKGAVKRCQDIQTAFGIQQFVQCEKTRNPATGKITETVVNSDDLQGKTCVITDDICDGGFTFIKIAEQLKAKGAAEVVLYVTHGIFAKGLDVFDGLIDEIYTTNSIPRKLNDSRITQIQYP